MHFVLSSSSDLLSGTLPNDEMAKSMAEKVLKHTTTMFQQGDFVYGIFEIFTFTGSALTTFLQIVIR